MNDLTITDNKNMNIWEGEQNLQQIKQIFAPTLTSQEFVVFTEMGKLTGLNPFLKEIWAVKYDTKAAAQIFIGRDGYRKSAQRHPFYDYHFADAIYSNDIFEMVNGQVNHRYKLTDRGQLIGAYCMAKRKGASMAHYVFVNLSEYDTGQSVWRTKKATMIKKVAEAQGLRAAFQELFAGTYSELEEFGPEGELQRPERGVQGLKAKLGLVPKNEATVSEKVVPFSNIEFEEELGSVACLETVKSLINGATCKEDLANAAFAATTLSEQEKSEIRAMYKEKEKQLNA